MFLTIICTILLSTFGIAFIWWKRNFNYWSRHKIIPSVRGRVFSGNFMDFVTLKTHFGYHLKTIYDDPKFRNEAVIGIYGLYKPTLLVREPELLKSIFVRDFDCFSNRFAQPDLVEDPVSSLMLIFAKYPFWKEMRSKLTPFFSSARLKQMYPLIQHVACNLEQHLKKKGHRFVDDVKELCLLFTLDVSSTTIFGVHTNSLENPGEQINAEARRMVEFSWKRALNHMCIFFMPYLCNLLGARGFHKETEMFLRSTIAQVMDEREKSGLIRNDLIDIFVKLKQEAQAKGRNMPEFMNGVVGQAALFWIGGYETSSSAISHALMEMAKQPKFLTKLRVEILDAFVEEDGDITYDRIHKMEYLDMVVKEITRMYPLFTFLERKYEKPAGRKEGYNLEPYYNFELPDGMPVYIPVMCLHYDEKYWPNPTKFNPERFSAENRDKITPMTYIPFGEGPRNCVGARLGMLQIKVGLVHFLKNHFVQVCDRTQMHPEFDPKATIVQIKGGIYLEIIRDDMCDKAVDKN